MASDVTTPPLHSKRVQAWVYAVINPLIESLRREISLLDAGDITWRFHSKSCEYIRPLSEYIERSQLPNYDDFLRDSRNRDFRAVFERHDHEVSEVESAAARLFDRLTQSEKFLRQVKDSLAEYESHAHEKPQYPDLGSIRENLPNFVAELQINRTDVLPHHYMLHKFWEDYRFRFIDPEKPWFHEITSVTDALHDSSKSLLSDLENHRYSLCATYDIPAAPILLGKGHGSDAYAV